MKPLKIQEKLLLLKVRKKDPDAFGQIYDLYVTSIYRFIYFKVANRADAEDLTSEVFLKIWQYLIDCEDEIDNLRALIYKFARNLVIDFYRERAKILEKSKGSVRVLLHRALKIVREVVKKNESG